MFVKIMFLAPERLAGLAGHADTMERGGLGGVVAQGQGRLPQAPQAAARQRVRHAPLPGL